MSRVDELRVFMNGLDAGRVVRDGQRLTLVYDESYRAEPGATPLSTGMPLTAAEHGGRRLSAFLDGLLPDNDAVRARWARQFHTRTAPFDLLAAVGEDCAGAVQFVRGDRIDALGDADVVSLGDDDIAAWITTIRDDPTAWLPDAEFGQFSLAGAQSKIALARTDDGWALPTGRHPTTHILKPASGRFLDYELNEHLSLVLARASGLRAARSEILSFGAERVVVVERYDRLRTDAGWQRIHQEDTCQALGVPPARKYESQRGPGALDIVRLLRQVTGGAADPTVGAFLDALAFNWLIAGTDAHAKNYSLLLAGRDARFAPLYDLASAAPYVTTTPTARTANELDGAKLKLAMSITGTYLVREVRARDWQTLGERAGVGGDEQLGRVRRLADTIRAALTTVVASVPDDVTSRLPGRFVRTVDAHLARCLQALDGRPVLGRRPGR